MYCTHYRSGTLTHNGRLLLDLDDVDRDMSDVFSGFSTGTAVTLYLASPSTRTNISLRAALFVGHLLGLEQFVLYNKTMYFEVFTQ